VALQYFVLQDMGLHALVIVCLGEVALDNTAGVAFECVLDFDTQQALASTCRLKAFPYRQVRLLRREIYTEA